MARRKAATRKEKGKSNGANLGFEEKLWQSADKLRGNLDAAEYKHVVLGLIFLKYISDAFESRRAKLEALCDDPESDYHVTDARQKRATLEERDEYVSARVFWVPEVARWGQLQAAAKSPRVNRVFRDKPGGLVVDFLGIADQLKRALATYTESGGKGNTAIDQDEAVAVMLEKYEIVAAMFHGFDYSAYFTGAHTERLSVIPRAMEHILQQEEGKERYLKAVNELSKAFALAVPHPEAIRIRDDVGFFQTVRR